MAAKSTLHLFSELERRYLECGVCSDVFNEGDRVPRLLPCHHTFCTACLKKICKRQHVKCPTCNAKHKLQENSVLKFPKDNTRRDLTSFIETYTNRSKCADCDAIISSVYQCITCSKHLCEICIRSHEKHNPKHKLKTVEITDDNKDACIVQGHNNAEYKYFCNSPSCQCVACPMCVIEDHRDKKEHELEDIQTAFNSRELTLKSGIANLRDRISHIKNSQEKSSINAQKLTETRHAFRKKVDSIFNRGIKNLQHQRDKLLEMYNPQFDKNQQRLNTRVAEFENFISNSEECCNLTEELLKTSSIPSFLSVHQVLHRHVQQFLNFPLKEKEVIEDVDYTEAIELFKTNTEVTTSFGQSHGSEEEKSKKNELKKRREILLFLATNGDRNGVIQQQRRENLRNFLFQLFVFACIVFVLLMPISYMAPDNFLKELQWTSKTNSCFVCRNLQNTTYATYPENNMMCGTPKRPYIFKGGFLNGTMHPRNLSGFDFSVRFKRFQNHALADVKNVIFEFGLLAEKTTYSMYNGLESKVSFTFYECSNALELCMKTGDEQNIDVSRVFFASKETGYTEGIFHFGFNRDSSVSLVNLNKNETVYIFNDLYLSENFKPFFATYRSDQFSTMFTVPSTQPFEFDRKTVHSSLFISTDNKVISNRNTSLTYEHANIYNPYIFTKRKSFQNSNTRVVFNIHYKVQDEGKNMDNFLEFGFGKYEKNVFHVLIKWKLIPCSISYFLVFRSTGFCLKHKNESLKLLKANSPIRLYIHSTDYGLFNLFSRGFLYNNGDAHITFEQNYKTETILYVRRLGGTEIKINNDNECTLMDMGIPLLEECVVWLLYSILTLQFHKTQNMPWFYYV